MQKIIVTDKPSLWPNVTEYVRVLTAAEYLATFEHPPGQPVQIFNLCQSYTYQSRGYYVSLLAEARGHRPIPSVKTMLDIQNAGRLKLMPESLDKLINGTLSRLKGPLFELSLYFGKNLSSHYDRLAAEITRQFSAPLLRAYFRKTNEHWDMIKVKILSLNDIPANHIPFFQTAAETFFNRNHRNTQKKKSLPLDMAILINPDEANPPSNSRALKKFISAGEKRGFRTELITRKDLSRLREFNALFIRETTMVNNHTYLFSRRAQSEGLIVLDDPDSILKCTNKIYLHELFNKMKIPTLKAVIQQKKNIAEIENVLGYPCVVKVPDSSFSLGVKKAGDRAELDGIMDGFLRKSELLLIQEYMPTDFDWRIGILEGTAFYACKYYMAKGHWQIYNWDGKKTDKEGFSEAVDIEDVPPVVLKTALKAANAVGKGLYGIDLKELDDGRVVLIEINDNPSIDAGVEDSLLKDRIYDHIMSYFSRQLKSRLGIAWDGTDNG